MSDPNFPDPAERPLGPPSAPPTGAPPPSGWGTPPPTWQPDQGFAQPAAQPYFGGYHGPEWIPELGVQTATAGARIGAKALDVVFFVALQAVLSAIGWFTFVSTNGDITTGFGSSSGALGTATSELGAAVVLSAIVLAVDFVYNVVLTARFGGQPGKLILGQRIIRQDGSAVGFGTAFVRWSPILALTVAGWIPHFAVAFLVLLLRVTLLVVNLVLVLADDRHQSAFDRIARTYVISTR